MRWIFLTLLLLNSLLAAVEWAAKVDKKKVLDKRYVAQSGVERLTLLKEVGRSPGESMVGGPDEASDQLCLLLGPADGRESAKKLIDSFGGRAVRSTLVTQVITKAPNYWVYLPPFESRKAAIKRLRELQTNKVDSYLITQGELANGISLGVFENIDSARRMLERRQNQGYGVKLTELGKKEFEYWVAVMEGYTEEVDLKVTEIMNELNLMFEKRQIFCKSVASEKKLP